MRTLRTILFTISCFSFFSLPQASLAAELGGVRFLDSLERDGTTLTLNGLGMRKATFFRVSVYVAGLYLPEKSSDAESILCCSRPSFLKMHFVRDVGVEKIRDGWTEGFKKNVSNLAPLSEKIERFNKMMKAVKEGQTLSLDITSSVVRVELDGTSLGEVEGEDFSKAVLRIWLGSSPPNEDLKEGLLGLS